MPLKEQDRAKLDEIVGRMETAGENDDEIRAVVADFKSKYEGAAVEHEPDTYLGGALKGFKEGALGGLKGYAEGTLEGLKGIVTGLPGVANTVGEHIQAVYDPRKLQAVAQKDKDAVLRLATAVKDTTMNAGNDPEAFGELMGQTTGTPLAAAGIGGAVSAGVRMTAGNPAVRAAASAALKQGAKSAVRRLPYVGPVAEDVAQAALEAYKAKLPKTGVEPNVPNVSGYKPGAPAGEPAIRLTPPEAVVEPNAPNTSGYDPAALPAEDALIEELRARAASPVDAQAPNVSGYDPAMPAGEPAIRLSQPEPVMERYAPNTSGTAKGAPAPKADPLMDQIREAAAQAEPAAVADEASVAAAEPKALIDNPLPETVPFSKNLTELMQKLDSQIGSEKAASALQNHPELEGYSLSEIRSMIQATSKNPQSLPETAMPGFDKYYDAVATPAEKLKIAQGTKSPVGRAYLLDRFIKEFGQSQVQP